MSFSMEHSRSPSRRPRLSRRAAVTVFWIGFYGLSALGIYLVTVLPSRGTTYTPYFLPLIPVGILAIVAGCLLAMDYQGMRAVFKRSIWVRMMDAASFWHDLAGPFGAGLMIFMGTGILIGGIVAAVSLAS